MHVHHMQHTFFKKRKKEKMRLDVKKIHMYMYLDGMHTFIIHHTFIYIIY